MYSIKYNDSLVLKRNAFWKCLNIKGSKCEICKYDVCPSSLVFHHLESSKKEFKISDIRYIHNMETIINELNKCQILCQNCHQEHHIDKDRFFKYEEEIKKKSKISMK